MLYTEKRDIKFRFVEDFPEYEEMMKQKHYYESDESESDEKDYLETVYFGKKKLHQIARVEWIEVKVQQEFTETSPSGKKRTVEKTVTMYEERMGELGGWLEYEANLSQEGDCWVEEDGFVMGGARVSGDVIIKGKVEIGDYAKVMDRVKISSGIGIGGNSIISGDVEIKGKKRLAVFGNADVSGKSKVLDEAKVYGNAKVMYRGRLDWEKTLSHFYLSLTAEYNPEFSAEISGEARVYGNSVVTGRVSDKAEVFGNADVRGFVSGEAKVGGEAVVDIVGEVSGEVILLTGIVQGELNGKGVVDFPFFSLGAGSSFYMIPESSNASEANILAEAFRLTDEKKDKISDIEKTNYTGNVASLFIGGGCSVRNSIFKGHVALSHTSLDKCEISDSVIGNDEWYSSYLSGCIIEWCSTSNIRALNSTLTRVVSGDNIPVNINKCNLEDCVFVKPCSYMEGCGFVGMTICTVTVEGESLKDGFICESGYHRDYLPEWGENRVLYGKDVDFKGLKDYYQFVYKFWNREAYNKADSERILYYKPYDFTEYEDRALARVKWAASYITLVNRYLQSNELKRKDEKGNDIGSQDVDEARALYLFGIYMEGIISLPLARMSKESFTNVKDAVETTFESVKKKKFEPDYDFGKITEDSGLLELEERLKRTFNPKIDYSIYYNDYYMFTNTW